MHYKNGKKHDNGKVYSALRRYWFYGPDGATVHTATMWEDGSSSCNKQSCCISKAKTGKACDHAVRIVLATGDINETDEVVAATPLQGEAAHVTKPRGRSIDVGD